jgi:hypothetical protein
LQSHVDPENIILSSSSPSAEEHQICDVLPDPFVQRVPNPPPVDLVQGFRDLRDEVAEGFRENTQIFSQVSSMMEGFEEDLCGFSKELFLVRRELPRLQAQVISMREDMSKMQKILEETHNFQFAQKLDP